jgi:mono/diheme cytochrome c family protein
VPRHILLIVCAALVTAGCRRAAEPQWSYQESINQLPGTLAADVRAQIRTHAGTYAQPRMLTDDKIEMSTLKLGQVVYQKRCVQCHGVTGDGNGPAAQYLYPKPRDYRKGMFKFTSTPFGSRPQKQDLTRTIQHGIRGTSMPGFEFLPRVEIEAVVEYVLVLSQRGELEEFVLTIAEQEEQVNNELLADYAVVDTITSRWEQAQADEIHPLTPQPRFTAEHIAAGREAFLSRGCSKCHGEDGRGMTEENLKASLRDEWGNPTRAADLTSGMLRGGQQPLDIYRRIYGGINGTPMPGFGNQLSSEPETIWNLVAYVMSVSNRRRFGEAPPPGPMAPYLPAGAVTSAGED